MNNYITADKPTILQAKYNWAKTDQASVILARVGSQIIGVDWFSRNNKEVKTEVERRSLEQTTKVYLEPFEVGNYRIFKPLTFSIEALTDDEFIATFDEAEISISDSSITKAVSALKHEIIEVYKLYKSAEKLGPRPKRQLSILEKVVGKK